MNNLEKFDISANQPLYLYQQPMFMLTVSVVLLEDNGVIVIDEGGKCTNVDECIADEERSPYIVRDFRFPGGLVKAGQETIQFSAVRQVKEQTGILLKKDALIPVDFRSCPERSKEGNVVDIGMVCILHEEFKGHNNVQWMEVDFELRRLINSKNNTEYNLYMDHNVLLERALDIAMMMKA